MIFFLEFKILNLLSKYNSFFLILIFSVIPFFFVFKQIYGYKNYFFNAFSFLIISVFSQVLNSIYDIFYLHLHYSVKTHVQNLCVEKIKKYSVLAMLFLSQNNQNHWKYALIFFQIYFFFLLYIYLLFYLLLFGEIRFGFASFFSDNICLKASRHIFELLFYTLFYQFGLWG